MKIDRKKEMENYFFPRQLSEQRQAQIIVVRIFSFGVSCLPHSVLNSLSMASPRSVLWLDLKQEVLTVLHCVCSAQYSLNFIIYTLLPTNLRQIHLTLIQLIKHAVMEFLVNCKQD